MTRVRYVPKNRFLSKKMWILEGGGRIGPPPESVVRIPPPKIGLRDSCHPVILYQKEPALMIAGPGVLILMV